MSPHTLLESVALAAAATLRAAPAISASAVTCYGVSQQILLHLNGTTAATNMALADKAAVAASPAFAAVFSLLLLTRKLFFEEQ